MKQLENDCMVRTIATDLAIEAEKDKREVTLPPEYQKYASVTIRARTSRAAYSPVMTTVLRRRHLILVMDSHLSQQSSITCTIMTHS